MGNLNSLPADLPRPVDDGGASHLHGMILPELRLPSTLGHSVDLASPGGYLVLYCYPMTGRPGVSLPNGWEQIPGARGCTPQSCAFRDHYEELKELGATVYGVSTQTTEYQREAAQRLLLPFALLSDADSVLSNALSLPTFEVEGRCLIKRLTLIIRNRTIVKVFYPVFPPDRNADDVIQWLRDNRQQA